MGIDSLNIIDIFGRYCRFNSRFYGGGATGPYYHYNTYPIAGAAELHGSRRRSPMFTFRVGLNKRGCIRVKNRASSP